MMTDGHRYNSVGERKLIWDEENRLLSVDDNGFVSNYWYDADGERTVKTSGKSDQVYVNGVFSGGSTNTAKFSLYVSPYLVANLGGRYTKHIYAGSQRIVSKVGDFASYGSDPRRIEYAGSETDGLSVDYKSKYTAQQQVIKDHYQFFDVPYNGTDNNNYADGEGFCCNDGTLEAAQAKAMKKSQSRVASRSFKAPDIPMMRSKMVSLFVLLLASAISYILPHTFVDRVCGSSFHTQYNFRDLLKLLCKGICYALSLCKVKALLGFQNLHAYGSYFGAKPCIDVHNTFLRHIISNKSRK